MRNKVIIVGNRVIIARKKVTIARFKSYSVIIVTSVPWDMGTSTASVRLRVKRLRRAAHSTARNAVLVPIFQGTEVTIVTEYVPFRYSTRTASVRRCMGTSTITPCYDGERLKTQTHVGEDPGELIKYTKHRLSRQGHPWPGCRPV